MLGQAVEGVLDNSGSHEMGFGAPALPRVSLLIKGIAAPKGSRTVGTRKDGSHYTRESSKASGPWVEQVAYCARVNRPAGKTLAPPYKVSLKFSLPEPAKPSYGWPSKGGDLDKLVRGVLDGLVHGKLIVDDRHITAIQTEKRFGPPSVAITIT